MIKTNEHHETINTDEDELSVRKALVFVTGSSRCKIGYASEDRPRFEIRTVVGRPQNDQLKFMKHLSSSSNNNKKEEEQDVYMCEEAHVKREILIMSYPIQHGLVVNWTDLEHIWFHAFYTLLQVPPEEQPILLTEIPLNPKANQQRLMKLMFTEFNCPAIYVMCEAVLALYSVGRATGCTLDIGDSITHASCTMDGQIIPHSIVHVNFGGKDLTTFLSQMTMSTMTLFIQILS